jgi:hypothetical protein
LAPILMAFDLHIAIVPVGIDFIEFGVDIVVYVFVFVFTTTIVSPEAHFGTAVMPAALAKLGTERASTAKKPRVGARIVNSPLLAFAVGQGGRRASSSFPVPLFR